MESNRPEDNAPLPHTVRELSKLMVQHELLELDVSYADLRVRLKRGEMAAPIATVVEPRSRPAPLPSAMAPPAPARVTIQSPLAGIFYRSPSPDASSFVEEGDSVRVGQTVCIVEAMKVMNEIGAEQPCRIARILVQNAAVVEAGQDLMVVEEL